MKKLVAIAVLLLAAYAALPYYSYYSLAEAVRTADRDGLEYYVDWPVVRQRLKEELGAVLAKAAFASDEKVDLESDGAANLGKGLAGLFGPAIINNLVDGYVTPSSVATMLKKSADENKPANIGKGIDPVVVKDPTGSVTWAFFESPTSFAVHLQPKQEDEELVLRLGFYGTHWKLNGFVLPEKFYEK